MRACRFTGLGLMTYGFTASETPGRRNCTSETTGLTFIENCVLTMPAKELESEATITRIFSKAFQLRELLASTLRTPKDTMKRITQPSKGARRMCRNVLIFAESDWEGYSRTLRLMYPNRGSRIGHDMDLEMRNPLPNSIQHEPTSCR